MTFRIFLVVLFFSAHTLPTKNIAEPPNSYGTRMWYKKPSVNWNDALPIGNGRLGAMIYGSISEERISLNEQTLWSGMPVDGNNPQAKKYLPLVRKAALEKNYKKADSLSKFMQGPWTESYLPMADLFLKYKNIADSSGYVRELDLDSAIAKVSFGSDNNKFTRTFLSSFPDQVIAIQQTGNKKRSLTFEAKLTSKLRFTIRKIAGNHIVLKGKCPVHVAPPYISKLSSDQAVRYSESENGEGMNFEVHLLLQTVGGTISSVEQGIRVENADTATIYISASTSYNGYDRSPGLDGKDPSIESTTFLSKAGMKTFEQIKQRHILDYQPIFRRVSYNLGNGGDPLLPTDERLRQMKTQTDPELVALIAQFGRYLLIAGSRPGGQPVNLKGIWNERLRPEYSSNWCIDHDAQMFYYAVESSNLSEMHHPFLQFIRDLSKNGDKTARINYGMRGWCAHHNSDIWRCSNPVGDYGTGNPHWATWNLSGAWLSNHFFEHFLFTGDTLFLQSEAWPVMKGAAQFCLDWLVESNGKLISVPSVSPENTFITEEGDTAQISINSTSDIALIRELFSNCIKTTQVLQKDQRFADDLKNALSKMASYQEGSHGQLLEWEKEWRPVDPSHRHLSHMYPVFPGGEISPVTTRQLSDAAKIALSMREKTNCSWGFAWKAACWARLGEADSAWQTWQYQLQYVNPESTTSFDNYGLFPNLFNSDGRDVILNGNGAATAVLTEMIMQSHAGFIHLLPALPSVFREGSVKGLCARGGFVIDLTWRNGKIITGTIYSKLGNDCSMLNNGKLTVTEGGQSISVIERGEGIIMFKTSKGKTYHIGATN